MMPRVVAMRVDCDQDTVLLGAEPACRSGEKSGFCRCVVATRPVPDS